MAEWAKDGKFIYTGRRNEGGANFRSGECALFAESSAGYAGIDSEAKFDFEVRQLPYWKAITNAPQNTIIGGASLWVMSGHGDAEYKGAGEFLSFLSTSDVQAAGTRTPAICRSPPKPARRHAHPASTTRTRAPILPSSR